MFSLRVLYRRYASVHQLVALRPRNIGSRRLSRLGRIERVEIVCNQLQISGWSSASYLTIRHGLQKVEVTPSQSRADVQAVFGGAGHEGFGVSLPYLEGAFEIDVIHGETCTTIRYGRFIAVRRALASVKLGAAFLRDCLFALPSVITWVRAKGAREKAIAKQQIKFALRLDQTVRKRLTRIVMDDLETAPHAGPVPDGITIILPVYNAFDILNMCLERVFAHTDVPWTLIVIDDCSTDPHIWPFLQEAAAGAYCDRITLLRNPRNLGFIGSTNRGLELALLRGMPVVLLNSDALVPLDWASRLIAPLRDPNIASVTPMSNDAEIMSVPKIAASSQCEEGVADRIDATARRLMPEARPVVLPTGVGFCMALAPQWLAKVPQFDGAFGRGYGEEVDWCRKVMSFGGHHVAQPSLFVEHRGGQSFGSEEKLTRISANNKIIAARYKGYDEQVQDFIRSDPLIGPRMLMALALASERQTAPVSVIVAHSLGGGADDATEAQVSALNARGETAVIVRLGGTDRFVLELRMSTMRMEAAIGDQAVLDNLLAALGPRRVVYACGVGDCDPLFLPDWMVALVQAKPNSRLEIEFHDYFPISPSYTLLDHRDAYWGVPLGGTETDAAHRFTMADGTDVELDVWQDTWGRAIARADSLIVYSAASASIVKDVWQGVQDKIEIIDHKALFDVPSVSRKPLIRPKVIGVLGNIGPQKGAQVHVDLAHFLKMQGDCRIVVIGNIDPQYTLCAPSIVHGKYDRKDIATLAERYALDCWLIPSIWPETFSFATREAIATGLPVWCFDLGAQASAVRNGSGSGGVIPLQNGKPDVAQIAQITLNR